MKPSGGILPSLKGSGGLNSTLPSGTMESSRFPWPVV